MLHGVGAGKVSMYLQPAYAAWSWVGLGTASSPKLNFTVLGRALCVYGPLVTCDKGQVCGHLSLLAQHSTELSRSIALSYLWVKPPCIGCP